MPVLAGQSLRRRAPTNQTPAPNQTDVDARMHAMRSRPLRRIPRANRTVASRTSKVAFTRAAVFWPWTVDEEMTPTAPATSLAATTVPTRRAMRGYSVKPVRRHIGTANVKATTAAIERPATGMRRDRAIIAGNAIEPNGVRLTGCLHRSVVMFEGITGAGRGSSLIGTTHTDHNASVGDMRAARSAGSSPATAPMRRAAVNPLPQARTGMTICHPLVVA